jgi:glycosyltransferase involved in cell wall biosynthesis
MNILYITQSFSATRGGGEVIFYDFAEGMAKRGHHVDIVSHKITNFKDENNLDGVIIHRIRPAIEYKSELPPSISQNMRYIINAIVRGSKTITAKKIHIIHTDNFASAIVGSVLAKIHNIPVIITNHGIFTINSPDNWNRWTAQNNTSRIYSVIGPLFEKITTKVPADIIHTVSYAMKEDLVKFNVKHDIVVIHNGINLRNYDNFEFDKDYQNYILYIGRLVFVKNLDVVISAFKDVVKKVPNAKLIVVGDGPMRDKWEKMVSELHLDQNIEFTGYISHEKKIELLSKCSSLLLPSSFEPFGLVLLEAFAMSKPVLVSDQRAFYEIVDEGVDGFILPTHDASKWAEKIIFLLSNKTICQDMGNKGRLKVESKFNIDNVVNKMESLYTEICFKKSVVLYN